MKGADNVMPSFDLCHCDRFVCSCSPRVSPSAVVIIPSDGQRQNQVADRVALHGANPAAMVNDHLVDGAEHNS